jgi:hypothetical protein
MYLKAPFVYQMIDQDYNNRQLILRPFKLTRWNDWLMELVDRKGAKNQDRLSG